MNALGHMTEGLVGGSENTEQFCLLQYHDADNGTHPNISHFPFIVLRADNSNQIRTLRNALSEKNIPFTDFTSTMTIGISEDQQRRTAETSEVDLEYWGICTFADADTLRT